MCRFREAAELAIGLVITVSIPGTWVFCFFYNFFFPGLDGLPLPTTPSTKKARAGQLNKKDQIAKSLKVPVFINAAHLRRGIRGAMQDGPTFTYAHCS